MLRYWLPYSKVVYSPRTFIKKSPYNILTIYTSRFLYFGSWNTLLTATSYPDFLTRALNTLPNVPWPISSISYRSFPVSDCGVESKVPSVFNLAFKYEVFVAMCVLRSVDFLWPMFYFLFSPITLSTFIFF